MNCISTRVHSLHVSSGPRGPVIRSVSQSSPDATAYVIAVRAEALPPMVLIVDREALNKRSVGMPASAAIHTITAWTRRQLPTSWLDDEGVTWVCMNGSSSFHVLLVDRAGVVTWRQVKWPRHDDGTLDSFKRAFPVYADAFLRVIEMMGAVECDASLQIEPGSASQSSFNLGGREPDR